LNLFNAWEQLRGGRQPFSESTVVATGDPHPPGAGTNLLPRLTGWDFTTIAGTNTQDQINHYYFAAGPEAAGDFTLTATLAWHRQSLLTDCDLFLYDTATGNLVACSTSRVDNVEHLFLPRLAAGRYDLQVLKRGGPSQVNPAETYALAWECFRLPLRLALTNGGGWLSWPLAPAGFRLETTASLSPSGGWTNVAATVAVSNWQNQVLLPFTDRQAFFRLQRP
jgi:hypothetical protein